MSENIVGTLTAKLLLVRDQFTAGLSSAQAEAGTFADTLVSRLAAVAAGYLSVKMIGRTVIQGFQELAAQDTAINRISVAMEGAGISTDGLRGRVIALGNEFISFGMKREEAYAGYQRLIQATGNTKEAENLLSEALRFAVVQGEDVGTVVNAPTKAYEGQPMLLNRLLEMHGFAAKSAKTFAESLDLIRKGGNGANDVLSIQTRTVNDVKLSWDKLLLKLSESDRSPILNFLHNINDALQTMYDLTNREWNTGWITDLFKNIGLGVGATPESPAAKSPVSDKYDDLLKMSTGDWLAKKMKERAESAEIAANRAALKAAAEHPPASDGTDAADKQVEEKHKVLDEIYALEHSKYDNERHLADEEYQHEIDLGIDKVTARRRLADKYNEIGQQQDEADLKLHQQLQDESDKADAKALEDKRKLWHQSYDDLESLSKQVTGSMASYLADSVVNMKFSLQSLADFAKQIFADMLKSEVEKWLQPLMDNLLHIPLFPSGIGGGSGLGGPSGYSGPDTGGGANIGSFGGVRPMGGYVPAPVSAGGSHVTVNNYITGDSSAFVEAHSETIVRRGMSQAAKIVR